MSGDDELARSLGDPYIGAGVSAEKWLLGSLGSDQVLETMEICIYKVRN